MSVGYFDNMIDWNYHGTISSNTYYVPAGIYPERISIPWVTPGIYPEKSGRCKYCGVKHLEHEKFCEGCGAPC